MKYCTYCKVKVMGNPVACPLCQSPLQGEGTPLNWPDLSEPKKQSVALKIIKFIIYSLIAVSLIIDFFAFSQTHRHYSVPTILVTVTVYWLISYFYVKNHSFPKMLFFTMIMSCLLVLYMGWFYDFFVFAYSILVPGIISVVMILNTIFSLFDKHFKSNYLVYIFMNSGIGIVVFIVIDVFMKKSSISWLICVSVSVVSLIGMVVFREKHVLTEIQKRLHI